MDKEFEFSKEPECPLSTTQESTAGSILSQNLTQPETGQRKQLSPWVDVTSTSPFCAPIQLSNQKRKKKNPLLEACPLEIIGWHISATLFVSDQWRMRWMKTVRHPDEHTLDIFQGSQRS